MMVRPWWRRSSRGHLDRRPIGRSAVLREEGLLERWLAADKVGQLVFGRRSYNVRDVARDAHAQDVVVGGNVADAGQCLELGRRDRPAEDELDLVMSEVSQGFRPIDAGELPTRMIATVA